MKLPVPVITACLCLSLGTISHADTLQEIYEQALENDAQLRSQQAIYLANKESANLGRAALLPQINASYDFTNTDRDEESDSIDFNEDTGEFEPIETASNLDIDREGYEISLNQAIFDLPAWFSFQAGKDQSLQAEAIFAADQQNLIVRVVESYLGVLRAQDNLLASEARETAFKRQLEQTRQRFEVGLIAITDV